MILKKNIRLDLLSFKYENTNGALMIAELMKECKCNEFIYYLRPGGIPARNSKGERLLLFLGIIDILQSYRLRKKLEHTFKAMLHDGVSIYPSTTYIYCN